MTTLPPIKDPNEVLENIKHIITKRINLYENAPQKPNIKVEIINERCKNELCPLDHTMVNITADFMLGEDILSICRYLKKNGLPFCYLDHSFKVILN